jgi:hypothetical protein
MATEYISPSMVMVNVLLVDMAELDELDKPKALLQLMTKLAEAKISVREEGTIPADDLEKELEL